VISGIVVGGVAAILLIATAIVMLRKRAKSDATKEEGTAMIGSSDNTDDDVLVPLVNHVNAPVDDACQTVVAYSPSLAHQSIDAKRISSSRELEFEAASVMESEPPEEDAIHPACQADATNISITESDREFGILNFGGTPANFDSLPPTPALEPVQPVVSVPEAESVSGFVVTERDVQDAIKTVVQAQLSTGSGESRPSEQRSHIGQILDLVTRSMEASKRANKLNNALQDLRRRVKKLDKVRGGLCRLLSRH
jgi:hypothetical protein